MSSRTIRNSKKYKGRLIVYTQGSEAMNAVPRERIAVVWFDGHGDCNTPETFTGDFLDAMGLSTLTGRCWQALSATVPGFRPLPDEQVLLIGAQGADAGARNVLASSNIGHVTTAQARKSIAALQPALDRLARQGVTSIYLHLDLDVLDAAYAPANEFAPSGGFLPAELSECLDAVLGRFQSPRQRSHPTIRASTTKAAYRNKPFSSCSGWRIKPPAR